MRRIKLVMATAAVMMAIMVVLAAPAMADKDKNDRRHNDWFDHHRFDRHDFRLWDNDFKGWSGLSLAHHEVCWLEYSWVFERWDLECA